MPVIVPCGLSKIWDKNTNAGPTLAKDAYKGSPFKLNRQYAESFGNKWVTLSAKYGFILPDFEIPGPFDRRKRIGTNESLLNQAIAALAATPPTIHAPDDVFARGEYFGFSSHQTSNERPLCSRVQKLDASVAIN